MGHTSADNLPGQPLTAAVPDVPICLPHPTVLLRQNPSHWEGLIHAGRKDSHANLACVTRTKKRSLWNLGHKQAGLSADLVSWADIFLSAYSLLPLTPPPFSICPGV